MSGRAARSYEHYEDDLQGRASGRSSRPRSKRRPTHSSAVPARVTTVDRGRYTCRLEPGPAGAGAEVTAVRARELRRGGVVVGDLVALVGDVSGEPGTLARLVRVEPRTTTLRRSADDTDPEERVLVANADLLGIVTAATDPEPRPRLIDRCLVAAYDGGLTPLLIVTKTDLAAPDDLVRTYSALDVGALATRRDGEPDELLRALTGHRTVLVGASGVGKSTLVNALVPDAGRAVGHVNPVTGRGRHTSSSAIALPLEGSGWVIDTPGVRSFGLEPDPELPLVRGNRSAGSGDPAHLAGHRSIVAPQTGRSVGGPPQYRPRGDPRREAKSGSEAAQSRRATRRPTKPPRPPPARRAPP